MKWNQLDYYRKSLLVMLPFALILLLYLLIANPWSFLRADWFFDLMIVPTFFGTLLSSAGYVGRTVDAVSPKSKVGIAERIGTCIGLACGLTLGIGLVLLRKAIPLVDTLHSLASVVFTLFNINSFAGLGQRVGSFIDNNARPKVEKRAIATMGIMGLAAGLALFFTNHAALVCIAGVTSFFTGGVALPFVLCGVIFATSFSGMCASSADYFSKAGSFIRADSTNDPSIKSTVKERFHEYRGAFTGVSTGLIIGAVIITALAITQPYLFAGIVGLLTAAMVVTACVSVIGGLCSRIGRLIDSREKLKKANEIELMPLTPKMTERNEPDLIGTQKKMHLLSSKKQVCLTHSNFLLERDRHSLQALIKRTKMMGSLKAHRQEEVAGETVLINTNDTKKAIKSLSA